METINGVRSLVQAIVPVVVVVVIGVNQGFGPMLLPFLVVAGLAVLQITRKTSFFANRFSPRRKLHGSVADLHARGRLAADDILNDPAHD